MKKIFLSMLTIMMLALLSVSCSNDVDTPQDETMNKFHDDPSRMVITLVYGHFHGIKFHQNPVISSTKYIKNVQTITYNLTNTGWKIDETGDTCFHVRTGTTNKDEEAVYGMLIKYYDKNGNEITGQFVENGQDQIHQHFFTPRNVTALPDVGVAEVSDSEISNFTTYTYLDTDPWNKSLNEGATLIGDKNPIGFKGYFNFLKARKRCNLQVRLLHARKSKFVNGVAAPFYEPYRSHIAAQSFDVIVNVPVYTMWSVVEEERWVSGENVVYEDLNDTEKLIIRSIAAAYSITITEALEDWNKALNNNVDPESGSIWF